MYNLEHLRMFVETVETGSFSACAQKLGKVQSAVSQAIANLELDLDLTLFDRSTRKPSLTPQGERLLSYAQAVLQQADEFNHAAQALNHQQETQLTLALDSALMMPKLVQILREFGQRYPATELEVLMLSSTEIAAIVENGRADIGLMLADLSFLRTVELCSIGNLPFIAVCHPHHPLAECDSVSAAELIAHRQIVPRGADGENPDYLISMSPQVWWSNSYDASRTLIHQGLGWGYMPLHLVEEGVRCGTLSQLRLSFDHLPWSPPVDRVLPKNRPVGPVLGWLAEQLKALIVAPGH